MLELTVLLVSIGVILFILYYKNRVPNTPQVESFDNYYLTACPSGYKSFYNTDGDVICCDGDVMANKCLGDRQCTLNGAGTPSMPNCVVAIMEEYAQKAKTQCPQSMPTYFENRDQKLKGCTNGSVNSTLTGPKKSTQASCTIFAGAEQNINSKNSCYNQKLLDSTPCFGNNCTKELIQPVANGPILIGIGFTDTMGVHHVAYTRQSMENFLNATNPNWRNQGLDLTRNISVAEVAKAFYVDKTMDQSQVQF